MQRIFVFIFLTLLPTAHLMAAKKHTLYWATEQNDAVRVPQLLRQGVNANGKSKQFIPLHIAIKQNYPTMAGLLLLYGAHINETNDKGLTILHLMAQEGNFDMCKYLIVQKAGINTLSTQCHNTALHFICAREPRTNECHRIHAAIVEFFLANNADYRLKNKLKKTPLALARATGQLVIVKLLHEQEDIIYRERRKLLRDKNLQQLCDILVVCEID